MSVPLILALLLLTLTLAMTGTSVLSSESARQKQLLRDSGAGGRSAYVVLRQNIERWSLRRPTGQRLARAMVNASINASIVDVVLVVVMGSLVLLLVAYDFGGPILGLVALVSVVFGLRAYLRHRRLRRLEQFTEQLPELARLLANATQAGLSLTTALGIAAQETSEPLRTEVRTIVEEVTYGAKLEDALARMGERLPSRELALLVNVLVIQIRAGGHVVSALRGVTESLENRRNIRREVKTLLASSRATMFAVVGLGLLIGGIGQHQIKGGLRGMLGDPLGFVVAALSAGLFVLGISLVNRFSRVDV